MSDAIWALQRALYQTLSADAALKALIGDPARIYDDPPEGAALPYIVIGATKASDWQGVPGGVEHELQFLVFSKYAGRKEIKEIIAALYDALHEADVTVDGHRLVNIRFVFGDMFRRQNPDIYQGVARFRAVTQPL